MAEKLSKYCSVISGYAFKSIDLREDNDIPVIKIGNISNGANVIIDDSTQYVDSSFLSLNEKYHVKKGDILISLTGSHINQPNSMVGRCCRNKSDRTYLLNQRAGKVIPKDNVDKDFLYYVFSMNAIKYAIANRAYGGANQVNVSPTDIMNIKFIFPEIGVQRKIAEALKGYDNLIDINTEKIKRLEKMAENLYKEWFVRFRFPGYENTKFEHGIPSGWKIDKVKNVVKRLPYGKLYKKDDTTTEGTIIVIDQSKDKFVGFYDGEASHKASIDNPIAIFGDHSCKFELLVRSFSLSENVIPYIAQKEGNITYLHYSLRKLIETTEYKRHWTELISKKIFIPPVELQDSFADSVKTMIALKQQLFNENLNLIKQRDLLLPRLMSGKLEVK